MQDKPSLEDLFAPCTEESFFDDYWQKKPLLQDTGPADRFDGLIQRQDIDGLVATTSSAAEASFMLTKDGKPLSSERFLHADGFADLAAIYEAYGKGYTLILTALEKRWPSVAKLCRGLERSLVNHGVVLSRRVGANLYLTPAGTRGFDPHYDNHDVFVIQLDGAKDWKIYDSIDPFPIERMRAPIPREQLPELSIATSLTAGQALYLPRGVFHEAAAAAESSLHITLSLFPCTWVDLLARALPLDSNFRAALPRLPSGAGGVDGDGTALGELFADHARAFASAKDLGAVAESMMADFFDQVQPLPDGGFEQLDLVEQVALTSRIRQADGLVARLRTAQGRASLRFAGSGFDGPEALDPVFRFLLSHDTFLVSELPAPLSDPSRIQLTQQLVREGLLRVESP